MPANEEQGLFLLNKQEAASGQRQITMMTAASERLLPKSAGHEILPTTDELNHVSR